MHVSSRADELPDHVTPIPAPETKRESEMPLPEAGLHPKCASTVPLRMNEKLADKGIEKRGRFGLGADFPGPNLNASMGVTAESE